MKITAIEIKPGMIIEHKNDYWNVLKTQHVKPGKGGAFNQVELKSVVKGTKLNERFRSNETVEKAEVDEKKFNLWNSSTWFFSVKTGDLIMFPSSTTHQVETKFGDNTRISLAFNTFYTGTLGSSTNNLTELIL